MAASDPSCQTLAEQPILQADVSSDPAPTALRPFRSLSRPGRLPESDETPWDPTGRVGWIAGIRPPSDPIRISAEGGPPFMRDSRVHAPKPLKLPAFSGARSLDEIRLTDPSCRAAVAMGCWLARTAMRQFVDVLCRIVREVLLAGTWASKTSRSTLFTLRIAISAQMAEAPCRTTIKPYAAKTRFALVLLFYNYAPPTQRGR
jgi:hypothetical protein